MHRTIIVLTQSRSLFFDFGCFGREPRRDGAAWLPGRWLAAGRRDDGARIVCFTHTHTHTHTCRQLKPTDMDYSAVSTTMYMSSAARLCAPLSNTSAVAASHFVDASACEPYCTLDDCHRCACRACSQCACTDRLGHPLPSGVCNQPREGEQVALGHAKTALDCRQACDEFDGNEYRWLDGYEYRPGKSSCTVWMHDASNGMC
jgi:hypothetical protein